jgi:hypothetical protein
MLRVSIVLFAMFLPILSFAETIELRNGKIVEGKVVDEGNDWVKKNPNS